MQRNIFQMGRRHGKSHANVILGAKMLIEDALKQPGNVILYMSPMENPPLLSAYKQAVEGFGFTFTVKSKEKQGDTWGRVIEIKEKKK